MCSNSQATPAGPDRRTRSASGARAGRRPARRAGRAAILAALLAPGLALTGCGAAPATSTASPGDGGSAAAEPAQDMLAYSQCMRDNGVSGFPDPGANGGLAIDGDTLGVDPRSETYTQAEQTCQPLMPTLSSAERQQQYEAALEHAACMRQNGLPEYPDPPPPGEGDVATHQGDGQELEPQLDPFSPAFQAAQAICQDLLPEGAEMELSSQP